MDSIQGISPQQAAGYQYQTAPSQNQQESYGTNTLERSPQSDVVETGNNQVGQEQEQEQEQMQNPQVENNVTDPNNPPVPPSSHKGLKILAGLGIAALGVFFGRKALNARNLKKAYEAVDTKFADLDSKLPDVQKTFKKVFMRDDLTPEQTKEILDGYKELERMRVNKHISTEEYAQAVMDKAVRNYGLEHAGIKLEFKPMENTKAGGTWNVQTNSISIKDNADREWVFGAIHHELRHAKQSQAICESLSEAQQVDFFARNTFNNLKRDKLIKECTFEEYKKDVWTPDFTNEVIGKIRKNLAREGFKPTAKDTRYASLMANAERNYTGIDESMPRYWTNGKEQDARYAETLINKLFGLNKGTVENYAQRNAKYDAPWVIWQ